jgi:hypothetical protein
MKTWKLTNVFTKSVKVVISTSSSTSVGVLLEPNQFLICVPKQTPTMDAQIRRKFITEDMDFDNQLYGFALGIPYDMSVLESKKIEIAESMAIEYKKNAAE